MPDPRIQRARLLLFNQVFIISLTTGDDYSTLNIVAFTRPILQLELDNVTITIAPLLRATEPLRQFLRYIYLTIRFTLLIPLETLQGINNNIQTFIVNLLPVYYLLDENWN